VGLILGFILGVAQAFLRDFLDNSIKTSEDIEKLTHIPLYAITPLLKSKKMIPYYQEAIRSLWINLAFLKTKSKSKLISVTSAISGEGKSFTLYHLSKMIAKSGDKSVIVLDLDMRRASQHKYFNLDNTKRGMSELLANKCTLEEAILPTEYSKLNVITSGPKTSNPTGLIMSFALESIIDKLSQRYDYIFLDTPPIGLVSDATKIMYLSDITLFVVKADSSTKEYIKEINRLNEKEEVDMGIVLNGIDYGKKYGYGYKTDYMDGYLTKD
ncbi:MAG: polysaccharide biosynthesis tyrosine autokinase, partial [Campylobacterota bacterium]|nr:polysaccharide biosynthesis tyrosine autokinase [Campylobacterota bacterium]